MEGVVLAGVHAWGECVLESLMCRPLFPIAGFPLVGHTLNWLHEGGIKRVSVCANSDTAALRRSLGDGASLGLALNYYEDIMPRGPAGCTRDAVLQNPTDTFVVVEGTVLPQLHLVEILEAHRASDAVLTVVVADGEPGHRGCEPRSERLEPVGLYIFSANALSHVPETGYQDIKEALIPRLYAAGLKVATYVVAGTSVPRVTNAASYMAISRWAVERLAAEGSTPEGYVRIREALIHESVRLHASARFVGPVLVGPHCRIEEDAMIVGPTSLGAGCSIRRQAVVSRSVLWGSCQVGEGVVLDHCILTDAAEVVPGTVTRETICLPRPRRRTWVDRLRGLMSRDKKNRPVAYVPPAFPVLALSSKPKSPNVTVKSDLERVGASPTH